MFPKSEAACIDVCCYATVPTVTCTSLVHQCWKQAATRKCFLVATTECMLIIFHSRFFSLHKARYSYSMKLMLKALSLLAIIVGATSAVTDKPLKTKAASPSKPGQQLHKTTTSTTLPPPQNCNCNVPNQNWVGDGYCDGYP